MSNKPRFLWAGLTACLVSFPVATGSVPAERVAIAAPLQDNALAQVHPALRQLLERSTEPVKAWVLFRDKGIRSDRQYADAIQQVAASYNPRAVQRRALRSLSARRGEPLFAEHDLPVVQAYVDAIAATGARVHVTSSWVNAVSVYATAEQIDRIAALPCVKKLQPVARSARIVPPMPDEPLDKQPDRLPPAGDGAAARTLVDYGNAYAQLAQMNLIALHNEGYTGAGVIVGVLDTGFTLTHQAYNNAIHPLNVVAAYDFVNDDPNVGIEPGDPSSQHDHGTKTLSCVGAYMPGSLVGGAYDASFILAKTEDTAGEYPAEEDNYVAGLQFIEANGGDMATSSLGYIDWYTQADLDGLTAVTTIAVNISTSLGVHHCNAAGNSYHDSNPATSSLIAPADGFQVITCGAVDSSGSIASFSSDGPTADGRVKPEVLARGVSASVISSSSDTGYTTASGTSFSTPLTACAVACLIQAKPYWTVDDLRQHLFETAQDYVANGTYDPLYIRGYGIVDAFAAYDTCSDAGVVTLDQAAYACESTASIVVNDCGLNADGGAIEYISVDVDSDSEVGTEQVTLIETAPDSAEFTGAISLSQTDTAGVLLVAPGDTVTITYVDADDGQGGTNVVVTDTAFIDCQAPTILSVQTTDVQPHAATVTIGADEPVVGTVRYGLACDALNDSAVGSGYDTFATVEVGGIQDNTTHYYAVDAQDEAGNVASDDNGGTCYIFTTPDVPNFFTEEFVSDNDLDNVSLIFTPNGSADYYGACVEQITGLPTDPAGGTTLSLSDDSSTVVTLTGGATLSLYGVSYGSLYAGSNGYITFGGGDTDYSETLADHFSMPRLSGVFDDLNPSAGGTVSSRQLADRVAVTYENVAEYGTANSNTFQFEMFFDGTIVISYLSVAVADGIAGLSEGSGVDPDFYETDLSNMGSCGPQPPNAASGQVSTIMNTPLTISLQASDDGLPSPPGTLTFIIESLPTHGTLNDPNGGAIGSAPYTLLSSGRDVEYVPGTNNLDPDSFTFKANDGGVPPEGGDSNVATISITVLPPPPEQVYFFNLDSDPAWSTEGAWAYGSPTGGGTHSSDPSAGHTGSSVYGYNLAGDYTNNLPVQYLTTTALNCSNLAGTELRFWKWLGVEVSLFDHADLAVSNNGTDWVTLWANSGTVDDASWSQMAFDISATADGQATVYVRWGMGPTDGGVTYPGWNIDDVEIWAVVTGGGTETCDDGILNQGEDLIDCGGPCPPCACLTNGDCNDTLFCTGIETCDAYGQCQAGTPVNCDDGVACTDDSCNDVTNSCDNIANDANCDDGFYCNGTETCDAVIDCQAGTPIDCDDGVVCTDDSCNDVTAACDNLPNDANCANGFFCDGAETCDPQLGCQPGTPVDCDDGVGCTDDWCDDAADDCENLPNDVYCDNGQFCDGSETCDAFNACQPGVAPCLAGEWCDDVGDLCRNLCTALGAQSCVDHGLAGVLCVDMGTVDGIEPRAGGIGELDMDLDDATGFNGGVAVACLNAGDVSGSVSGTSVVGNTVTVTFGPTLPDGDVCTVSLDCSGSVCVRGLQGDVDRNGTVATTDASIIKPKFGQTPTDATAVYDYDTSGTIATTDFSLIKPLFGNTALVCP